jgi:heptosyltransferase-2
MKIAVFCPSFIGDTVMATPTFRAIRHGFPDAGIAGVIRSNVAPTLDGTMWFDEFIRFDPRSSDSASRMIKVVRRLRAGRFDIAVLLPNTFRVAAMAWLAEIPRRIGYVRYARDWLLTDRLSYPRDSKNRRIPTPVVESYVQLARRLSCPVESMRIELQTTIADEAAADQAMESVGWPSGEPVVCLNTGGAYGPAKNWPIPYFAQLARRLIEETGTRVLVLCGPSERESARETVYLANHPRIRSLADQTVSIGLTKACIKRAKLLITTDSGPRHFAAAFDTPVITLFGPTHIAWTRTHHPRAWHLSYPVDCGPCQKRVCPEGHHRCMRALTPESVLTVALRALGNGRSAVHAASLSG